MVVLASVEELRCEALLHAWPPGPNADPPPEEGFDRGLFTPERWDEVEDAMRELYATGITHRPSFIREFAEGVLRGCARPDGAARVSVEMWHGRERFQAGRDGRNAKPADLPVFPPSSDRLVGVPPA